MATTPQQIPLIISVAPFPEGFEGDLDETFQQLAQLIQAYIEGNFLTGLILPPGSTPPTTDQGPVAIGDIWYFWDAASGQYLPQTVNVKAAKNFAKNSCYQIQQTGSTFTIGSGITNTFDMAIFRASPAGAGVLKISVDTGPVAGVDNDQIPAAIKYTVQSTVLPSPVATDLMTHEHVFEGADIASLIGQTLSLSFSIWSNQPGIYSCYLTSAGRDMSYVAQFTIAVANTWTRIKIAGIPALPISTGTWNFAQGATGLYFGLPMTVGTQWQTTNTNHWVNQFVAGTVSNINLCAVATNQLKVTGIKLEASPTITYFTVPSFDADYQELIRYYFTTFDYQSVTAGVGVMGNAYQANTAFFALVFPRRMCKVPTVVPYSWNTQAAGKVNNISTGVDYTAATLTATQKGLAGNPTGLTAAKGDTFLAYITADARLS